ncbi:polyprotein [Phytophthora megakarya]|uniref:Polyprotein n=1 Tax=Phytophthora megakarya TaxID=4795 RepID=A0A225WGY2_9STRA|nr:polyprotein [Phytophthora megakarya]
MTVLSMISHIAWNHQLHRGYSVGLLPDHKLAIAGMRRTDGSSARKHPITIAILKALLYSFNCITIKNKKHSDYNFYMRPPHIQIEMDFGLLTNMWHVFQCELTVDYCNVGKVAGPVGAGRPTGWNGGPGPPMAARPSSPQVLYAHFNATTAIDDSRLIIVSLNVAGARCPLRASSIPERRTISSARRA